MKLTFYKNKSENNVINKDLQAPIEIDVIFRGEANVQTPEIFIETTGNTILDYNYVYIPNYNRYYYIIGLNEVRNHYYKVSLKEDVLMSFKDEILSLNCIVAKQENLYDLYLHDGEIPISSKAKVYTRKFPNEFKTTDYNFILTVAGGI